MTDRLSTRSEGSVLQMESNNVNLIELLHQFSPSDILHLVETITYPRIMLSKIEYQITDFATNTYFEHKPYKNGAKWKAHLDLGTFEF